MKVSPVEGQCTEVVQAAIDAASRAGDKIVFCAGHYKLSGLHLRSNIELHMEDGAVFDFMPDYEAYAETRVGVIAEDSDRGMIVGEALENIAITGKGRIEANGARFSLGNDDVMGTCIPAPLRPRVLVLDRCRNVSIEDLEITGSPMWTLHLIDCDDVQISGLQVHNDRLMPNTDALVLDGCRNVQVANCSLHTADDGIVLKTSRRTNGQPVGICANIQVSNCILESRSCALKIGTESHNTISNVQFTNCKVETSNRALGIFSRDGGDVKNIRFSNINVECSETPDGFWGSGEALTITALDRTPERPAGKVHNVRVDAITGSMEGAILLYAERPGLISNVDIQNIAISQKMGALGTALRYDLRPGPADCAPFEEGDEGRKNSWRLNQDGEVIGLHDYPAGMPGLFAHQIEDLTLSWIDIERPHPLPEAFNAATIVEE